MPKCIRPTLAPHNSVCSTCVLGFKSAEYAGFSSSAKRCCSFSCLTSNAHIALHSPSAARANALPRASSHPSLPSPALADSSILKCKSVRLAQLSSLIYLFQAAATAYAIVSTDAARVLRMVPVSDRRPCVKVPDLFSY